MTDRVTTPTRTYTERTITYGGRTQTIRTYSPSPNTAPSSNTSAPSQIPSPPSVQEITQDVSIMGKPRPYANQWALSSHGRNLVGSLRRNAIERARRLYE